MGCEDINLAKKALAFKDHNESKLLKGDEEPQDIQTENRKTEEDTDLRNHNYLNRSVYYLWIDNEE